MSKKKHPGKGNIFSNKNLKAALRLFRSPDTGSAICISGLIASAIIMLLAFFVLLVPINLHDEGFWLTILFALIVYTVISIFSSAFDTGAADPVGSGNVTVEFPDGRPVSPSPRSEINIKVPIMMTVLLFLIYILIGFTGAKIFHAGAYSSILQVEDADFTEDLPEAAVTDSIALMDTDSARMLGDREIGSLSSLVSQFDVSNDYTQIDYQGSPKKIAALDYAGFFKWINNKSEGVPGYVTVDPVSMSASYEQTENGMIYVPSAYLLQDAGRHIYLSYPTTMWGNLHFEIDEDGNPYYIASVYKKTISLFGGETVSGCIILDPVTGEMQKYDLADVPTWVDDVYDGDMICEQYNWHGTLQNGFWNSLIAKKGCNQVTTYYVSDEDEEESSDDIPASDYGYVAKDGDIWIYTGVTSVNSDSSNIGFLLANERTGESHYFSISGADEKSAMSAAEGEVQEKGYQASFPSLINVDGNPTYIMVLKDNSGLVKLYAAVNVQQYNLVTTASTQKECMSKYRTLLGIAEAGGDTSSYNSGSTGSSIYSGAGNSSNANSSTGYNSGNTSSASAGASMTAAEYESTLTPDGEADITIQDIRYIDIEGNTWIYLISSDSEIYKALASAHEEMLLLQTGDFVHLTLNGSRILTCTR